MTIVMLPNETGFRCDATALKAILLHNARSRCLQQPVLERPPIALEFHRREPNRWTTTHRAIERDVELGVST